MLYISGNELEVYTFLKSNKELTWKGTYTLPWITIKYKLVELSP